MESIVVGVDGSKSASSALEMAAREAALHEAQLEIVVVWQVPAAAYGGLAALDESTAEALREQARRVADDALARVSQSAPPVECSTSIVNGQPAEALLAASEGADLVVVGSRGLGGFKRLMLGSVSDQVVHHATCPVLVVRGSG